MDRTRRHLTLAALAALAPARLSFAQGVQNYPDRPVRVVVGYSPGGLPDTVARVVAQRLSEVWKQQVIVDNRPGANTGIASDFVTKAAPDGYTLMVSDNSTTAINPFLYPKLAYDVNALLPITMLARAPLYLTAHPSFPATTLQEAIAVLKANPGKYQYGSSGIGSTHHLCMESFRTALGLDLTHIPFKGTGQSVPAVISGQVPLVWSAFPSLAAHAKEGRVRLLAVNSLQRSANAPSIPAVAEILPGFDFAPTVGILGPQNLPREIVQRIVTSSIDALKSEDVAGRLRALDVQPVGTSAEEYAAALRADAERYSRAVRASGAKGE